MGHNAGPTTSMNRAIELVVVVVYVVSVYCVLPIALVIGWTRWVKREPEARLTPWSILSLVGFTLATLSTVLGISSVLYAHAIGGFPFYDPLLMRIYRWGALLALGGFVCGIVGCWRRSLLRWYAPACAVAILVFWFVSAMGE